MSYKILKSKQNKKGINSSHTASLSYVSQNDINALKTFYNVSYTDYCGLSKRNRFKTEGNQTKNSLNYKRKSDQYWKNRKRIELAFERGDSFQVQPARIYDSPRGRGERMKTQYSQSKIFRNNKNKTLMDFYKTYELEFLQKKMNTFEASGHKLQLAKFNNIKPRQRKGTFRPNTAYLKRLNPHLNVDVRKIKTIDLKNLKSREQRFYAISGWENQLSEYET